MEFFRRIAHNLLNMLRGQRFKVNLRTTGTQGGIDMPRIPCRRANQHEICRRTFLKELFDIRRHLGVRGVIIGRLKVSPLVLQDLQQFILQHFIHFTDFVDEQNATMRIGDQARLWFRNPAVRQRFLRPLIDGVMDRAQQRIGDIARVPAQRRAVGFHKRCFITKGRHRLFLSRFEHQTCGRGLADPRWPIEQ